MEKKKFTHAELYLIIGADNLISFHKISQIQERSQGLLINGSQTSGNLLSLDYPFIKSIKIALEQ